jgi:hypothetical protein
MIPPTKPLAEWSSPSNNCPKHETYFAGDYPKSCNRPVWFFIKYIGKDLSLILLLNSNRNYSNQKPWLDILPTINRPIMTKKWISASTLIAKYKLAEFITGINRM